MKRTTLTLALIFSIAMLGIAQEKEPKKNHEIKTMLGGNSKARGFGTLELKTTEIQDDIVLMPGVTGGMILNNHFVLGMGFYGIANEVDFVGVQPSTKQFLYGGYGGLMLGALIAPREIVHIYVPVLLGAGGAYITENDYRNDNGRYINEFDESSAFAVIEPGIEIELNVTKFFKIGMGASYRYVTNSSLVNMSDDDLSGYSGSFSLKFGNF
ncbi:hypothetical protein [Fulvivirga lutimaris]|uniref:hypothetical protein n=1 Tax=Fulvivirga lutimaris TaxID=1819566 RepID=UPI0012BC4E8A|nr:hypothetical protein [Fulvivirga lutimaris]MTI39177.1 hypothetical protein [Fulvivirga lutimaris]